MTHDDNRGTARDVPFRQTGAGMATPTRFCLTCQRPRVVTGGSGVGVRWQCAHCVGLKGAK